MRTSRFAIASVAVAGAATAGGLRHRDPYGPNNYPGVADADLSPPTRHVCAAQQRVRIRPRDQRRADWRRHRRATVSTAGTVIGGVVGGALGNQVGSGGGRAAATVLGALGGALVGNPIAGGNRTAPHDSAAIA